MVETIQDEITQRERDEARQIKEALVHFVAVCETAPPILFIKEIGRACEIAKAALDLK